MGAFELIPGLDVGREVACLVLLGVCSMIASAGGVGGGPINVSLMLFLGVSPKVAIPLSKAAIFGGSLVLMLFNLFQRSPNDPELPIIQWDFVFVIEPAAVVGAFVGAVINSVLPDWFLIIVEAIFLTAVGIMMVRQGVRTVAKEKAARGGAAGAGEAGARGATTGGTSHAAAKGVSRAAARKPAGDPQASEETGLTSDTVVGGGVGDANAGSGADEASGPGGAGKTDKTGRGSRRTGSAEDDTVPLVADDAPPGARGARAAQAPVARHGDNSCRCGRDSCSPCRFLDVPRMVNFSLGILLITIFTFMQNFSPKCSTEYWIFLAAGIVSGLLAIVINTMLMHRSIRKFNALLAEKPEMGAHEASKACRILIGSDHPDSLSSVKYYIKFSAVGLLAGILSAALGIGGGLLKNPVLLAFGVDLFTARAASGTMITFTAFSSFITYLSLGQIDLSYAWLLMLVMTITFPTGYFVSNWVIRLVRSRSVIPFAMAIIVLLSDVVIIYQAVSSVGEMVRTGKVPGFYPFC